MLCLLLPGTHWPPTLHWKNARLDRKPRQVLEHVLTAAERGLQVPLTVLVAARGASCCSEVVQGRAASRADHAAWLSRLHLQFLLHFLWRHFNQLSPVAKFDLECISTCHDSAVPVRKWPTHGIHCKFGSQALHCAHIQQSAARTQNWHCSAEVFGGAGELSTAVPVKTLWNVLLQGNFLWVQAVLCCAARKWKNVINILKISVHWGRKN